MKMPSWKRLFLYLFLGWLFYFIYDLFLWDIHNDYKIGRIEQRMINNFWEHEEAFDLLFAHIQQLEVDSIISPPPSDTSNNYSYSLYYGPSIGPGGPVYFGLSGAVALTLDSLLTNTNCIDINYYSRAIDHSSHPILTVTFLGNEFTGFHYLLKNPDMTNHKNWTQLKENIFCEYHPFEMFCGRIDWRWE